LKTESLYVADVSECLRPKWQWCQFV